MPPALVASRTGIVDIAGLVDPGKEAIGSNDEASQPYHPSGGCVRRRLPCDVRQFARASMVVGIQYFKRSAEADESERLISWEASDHAVCSLHAFHGLTSTVYKQAQGPH